MPEKSQELFSQYVGEKMKFKESGHRAEMYNILKLHGTTCACGYSM